MVTYWKVRFDDLKKDHDKALIELMELTKKYNGLLDNYNKNIEDTEHEIREKHKIIGKYNELLDKYKSLLATTESNE